MYYIILYYIILYYIIRQVSSAVPYGLTGWLPYT
jgi:hypothetical protein